MDPGVAARGFSGDVQNTMVDMGGRWDSITTFAPVPRLLIIRHWRIAVKAQERCQPPPRAPKGVHARPARAQEYQSPRSISTGSIRTARITAGTAANKAAASTVTEG